jgi:hypothetical protein
MEISMKQKVLGCAMLVVLAMTAGCRKSASPRSDAKPTHESIVTAVIQNMKNTATSLNRVVDAKSAEQAATEVSREAQNLLQLGQQLVALGKASAADRQTIKKLNDQVTAAANEVRQAVGRMTGAVQSGRLPPSTTERLIAAGKQYGNAMLDFGQKAGPILD